MSKRKKVINLDANVAAMADAHDALLKVGINESLTLVSGNLQVTCLVTRLEAAPGVVR